MSCQVMPFFLFACFTAVGKYMPLSVWLCALHEGHPFCFKLVMVFWCFRIEFISYSNEILAPITPLFFKSLSFTDEVICSAAQNLLVLLKL